MLRAVHGLAPVATLRRPFGPIFTPFVPGRESEKQNAPFPPFADAEALDTAFRRQDNGRRGLVCILRAGGERDGSDTQPAPAMTPS